MPVVKRVVLDRGRRCSKCKRDMVPGTDAVKDRRPESVRASKVAEYKDKVWYHAECPPA